MHIVDAALARRAAEGRPITVGIVGAGFMGSAVLRQITRATPGMRAAAVAARDPAQALAAWRSAGFEDAAVCETARALEDAIAAARPAVTPDWATLAAVDGLDAVFEVTGSVTVGAETALSAIARGRHLVQMNAELDATLGPLLKAKADAAGAIYTAADGDQPGVQANLFRKAAGLGLRPVLCGNIKGLHDPRRTPQTQAAFAARWGQRPQMVTSFADGTKISFEQASVANGFALRAARRGMLGPDFSGGDPDAPATPIETAARAFDEALERHGPGLVDYVVGARPGGGVFVLAQCDDPRERTLLSLYKAGPGPNYCFYAPYHLCHFEAPSSIARAALFHDATLAPQGAPKVGVIAVAKRALAPGEVLDGFGGFLSYGVAENADVIARERLLPMGLAEGCRLLRAVGADKAIGFDDVARPPDRLIDRLWAEQTARFSHAERAP